MTSLIKGFVGTLSDALDINQATLSGCIDIIIVQHEDGSRHSTPFHVRFGKLQLLRSREKLVTIYVNGERTPLTMKLGRAGEAYFYEQFETDTDGEWSASPSHSPIHSPVTSPGKYSPDQIHERIVIQDIIEELLTAVENADDHYTIPTEICAANADAFPIVSTKQEPELPIDSLQNDLLESPPPLDLGEPLELNKKPSRRSTDRLWSVWSWGWGSLPVRKLATSSTDPVADDLLDSIYMEVPITSSSSSVPAQIPAPEHAGRSLSWVSSIIGIFRGRSDANILTTDPPLVDLRLFVTRRGYVRIQIQPRNVESPPIYDKFESDDSSASESPSSAPSNASIITPSSISIPVSHSLELSLCAHHFDIEDNATKLIRFRENVITFERLCSDPSIIYDPDLMVRYQDLFYPGKVALPLIMSYLAFGRPLTAEALEKFEVTTKICLSDPHPSSAGPSSDPAKSSFLYRWFGQDGSTAAGKTSSVATNNSTAAVITAIDSGPNPILVEVPTAANLSNSPETEPVNTQSPRASSHKTLRPTSDMLRLLNLNFGQNVISFCVESALQGMQLVEGFIYLWSESAKIVISDVDGTITRSDLLGNIMPLMGKDWSQVGVTSFFSNVVNNGYNILYLTSRAIGQANVTRTYLSSIKQGAISLPQGPVIMSPDSLISSFKREVIYRRPQEFKIPALRDIVNLFPEGVCPFVAGFGNRDTDIEAYIAVGIPVSMIFIIDPKGSIHRMKSIHRTSYSILNDQVDHMFPPFDRRRTSRAHASFSEFHFWREPIRSVTELREGSDGEELTVDKQDPLKVQISPAIDNVENNVIVEMPRNKR